MSPECLRALLGSINHSILFYRFSFREGGSRWQESLSRSWRRRHPREYPEDRLQSRLACLYLTLRPDLKSEICHLEIVISCKCSGYVKFLHQPCLPFLNLWAELEQIAETKMLESFAKQPKGTCGCPRKLGLKDRRGKWYLRGLAGNGLLWRIATRKRKARRPRMDGGLLSAGMLCGSSAGCRCRRSPI
jgi:hypothetical protein